LLKASSAEGLSVDRRDRHAVDAAGLLVETQVLITPVFALRRL
jgi:hypothetical protein